MLYVPWLLEVVPWYLAAMTVLFVFGTSLPENASGY